MLPSEGKAGPSTPLKYASLRMTGHYFASHVARSLDAAQRKKSGSFDSAEVRFAQDDRSF
jgi:hypothetical protein